MNATTRTTAGFLYGLAMAALLASCAGVNASSPEKVDDWLKADYQQMKKRLVMLERENSVLSEENEQFKKDNHAQAATIDELSRSLASLRQQCQQDIDRLNTEIARLSELNEAQQTESAQRIHDLTQRAEEAKLRYEQEVRGLEARLASEQERWGQESKALREESARKEQAFSREIQALKAELQGREETITSLRKEKLEQTERLEKALKALAAKAKEVELLQGELDRIRPKPAEAGGGPSRGAQGAKP